MFFVLGGGADTCLRTWADVTFAQPNYFYTIENDGGSTWVAGGGYGGYGPYHQFQYSTDGGSTWNVGTGLSYPVAPDQIEYSRVAWNGTRWVALSTKGLNPKNYATSTNASTWTYGDTNTISGSGYLISSTLSVIDGVFYAARNNSQTEIYESTDGATWTSIGAGKLPTSNIWGSSATNGTTSVIIGGNDAGTSNAAAYASGTDFSAISWSSTTMPASNNWNSVIWTGRIFFASSRQAPLTGLARSYDGITWEDCPAYPDPGFAQTFGGWARPCADSRGTIYLTPWYMASATANNRVWISVDDGETWCENTTSESVNCYGAVGCDNTKVIAGPFTQSAGAPTSTGSYGVR